MQEVLFLENARVSSALIARMSEEDAYRAFCRLRWTETGGTPVCPRCNHTDAYRITTRRRFKCKSCHHQFSVTSGTIFASRKLAFRDILLAIALFMDGAKGVSACQLARSVGVQRKTAFVLAHKMTEAMADHQAEVEVLSGEVEIDGAYFGGHVRPENRKRDRKDRRRKEHQNAKRKAVVVARERGGRTTVSVHRHEAEAVRGVMRKIEPGTVVYADDASGWDDFHVYFDTRRVNHSEAYSENGASTNIAESYFSRLRRGEIGTYHRISAGYLDAYAGEMAWREDYRKAEIGPKLRAVTAQALGHGVSRRWKGYWQRNQAVT